jgi:hypothetical protein
MLVGWLLLTLLGVRLVLAAVATVFFDFQLMSVLPLEIAARMVVKRFALLALQSNEVVLAHGLCSQLLVAGN